MRDVALFVLAIFIGFVVMIYVVRTPAPMPSTQSKTPDLPAPVATNVEASAIPEAQAAQTNTVTEEKLSEGP